jgi:hypothetical protein
MRSFSKHIAILVLVFSTYSNLMAQLEVEFRTMQKINLQALELVEAYSSYLIFKQVQDKDELKNLFTEDALIFYDVMPVNELDEFVSLDEYYMSVKKNYNRNNPYSINVVPYEISDITLFNKDSGQVTIYAKKYVSGLSKYNIDYTDTFKIEIAISFNLSTNVFLIKRINPNMSYGKYCILQAYKKVPFKDDLLQLTNLSLSIKNKNDDSKTEINPDTNNNYFIKRIYPNTQLYIDSEDDAYIIINKRQNSLQELLKLSNPKNTQDKNIRQVLFRQSIFIIEAEIGYNPFNTKTMIYKGNDFDAKTINENSLCFGANFGIKLFYNKEWKDYTPYLKTGLQYHKLNYMNNSDYYSYSFKHTDLDNDSYLRTIEITNIEELNTIEYLSFPIKFQQLFRIFESKTFLNIEFGLSIDYLMNAEYRTMAIGKYAGSYDQYYNIIFAENGIYDFGKFDLYNEGKLNADNLNFNLVSSLGISKRLYKGVSATLGATYYKGIKKVFKENNIDYSNNYKEINSLTNISNEYYRGSFCLDLKLTYNL